MGQSDQQLCSKDWHVAHFFSGRQFSPKKLHTNRKDLVPEADMLGSSVKDFKKRKLFGTDKIFGWLQFL